MGRSPIPLSGILGASHITVGAIVRYDTEIESGMKTLYK